MGWAITTILMAVCHDFAGLAALRFLMGMLEAPALPGLTLITTMWYTKKEQALRVALWSSTVASVRLMMRFHARLMLTINALGVRGARLIWYWAR